MGRKPPPAIFVRPEDILEAVRASIALGGTLPELRAETQALARDLTDMVRLRDAIGLERTRIASEVEGLARERVRLGALVDARQAALRATEKSAGDEAKRAAELARQAGSVRELLQKIESDIRTASRQAEEARRQEEARTRETQGRLAALAMRDPARLSPKVAFAEARGALQMPVEGAVMRGFGAFDETGAPARGQSIEFAPRIGCNGARRRLGGVRRTISIFRQTLDRQRRRRLLYSPCRHGENYGRSRPVRPGWRAGRSHGIRRWRGSCIGRQAARPLY